MSVNIITNDTLKQHSNISFSETEKTIRLCAITAIEETINATETDCDIRFRTVL